MIKLTVNGKTHELDVEGDTPLLWAIRDDVGLTGQVRLRCRRVRRLHGAARRRAHAVLRVALSAVAGGPSPPSRGCRLISRTLCKRPGSRKASAMRLLPVGHDPDGGCSAQAQNHPTDAEIDSAMTNICRCGTYDRVRNAIHRAARG